MIKYITSDTQKKIIDAFFKVASDYPNQKITVEMVSKCASMSRENVYHNHFRGLKDIIERVHFLVDNELYCEFKSVIDDKNSDFLNFLYKSFLPILYEKKEWLKVLYGTTVDPGWITFLQDRYTPLVEEYLDKIGKQDVISNSFLAQVIVNEFISIVSVWVTDEKPEPPSLFFEKFIYILKKSPIDMLTQNENK